MTTDYLYRERIQCPHSGPSLVYLRNNFFHISTCSDHTNDLYPIYCEAVKQKRSSVLVKSDNGPDYIPSSYKNELLYYQLWRKTGLDTLTVTLNAAGLSAFDPSSGSRSSAVARRTYFDNCVSQHLSGAGSSPAGSVSWYLNLQKLNYQCLTTSVVVVLVVG